MVWGRRPATRPKSDSFHRFEREKRFLCGRRYIVATRTYILARLFREHYIVYTAKKRRQPNIHTESTSGQAPPSKPRLRCHTPHDTIHHFTSPTQLPLRTCIMYIAQKGNPLAPVNQRRENADPFRLKCLFVLNVQQHTSGSNSQQGCGRSATADDATCDQSCLPLPLAVTPYMLKKRDK